MGCGGMFPYPVGSKGVGKSLSLISCHQGKCRDVF